MNDIRSRSLGLSLLLVVAACGRQRASTSDRTPATAAAAPQ